jgi:ribose 5-phosphate isomerase A
MATDPKIFAARAALRFVKPGMLVGLGSGSTASLFVEFLGQDAVLRDRIDAVCTSADTQRLAERHGYRLREIDSVERIDLSVDGADEVTPRLEMIKGGGGALFREKVVARLSAFHVTIVHKAKLVERLGGFALPVEIVPFAHEVTVRAILAALKACGATVERWSLRAQKAGPKAGQPFITDNGNLIADVKLAPIADPEAVAQALKAITGVVEHGLFLGLTHHVIVAEDDGSISEYGR